MSKTMAWLGFIGLAIALLAGIAAATDPASTSVSTPHIVSVSGTPANAFTNSTFTAREDVTISRRFVRTLQNVGTTPVLYALGSTVATTNYHGVLAAGTDARDGLGSLVDLSNWRGSVSVMCESGSGTVVTIEITR